MKKIILAIIVLLFVSGLYYFYFNIESDNANLSKDDATNSLEKSVSQNIVSSDVEYKESVRGYLAQPEMEGQYPGLILIHEWWGLNDNVKDLANDFAQQGYIALAVDLYNGEVADTPSEAGKLAGSVRENVDSAFANLQSATEYLNNLQNIQNGNIASVGWCFGGGWAYEMAKNDLNVKASVMYYGRFSPEDDLSMMRADILGHFGEDDASIAVDDVKQFEAKLKTLSGDHSVFIYPNAGHAFANEDNEDAYNEEAAKKAWERTLDFLKKELN